MLRTLFILSGLSLIALLSVLLSLAIGSVELSLTQVVNALLQPGENVRDSISYSLVWDLRLPRAITGFAVGAMLAVAGALMQVLLRNPLADPYILGVSGGAAVAALIAITLGASGALLTLSAFGGAFTSVLLVFGLAHSFGNSSASWAPTRLLLTGVVLASGWGAVVSFILAVSPDQNLRNMLFWLMGDLSYARAQTWPMLILLGATAVAMTQARHLNLLIRGEMQAAALGVSTTPVYWLLFVLSALLTSTAVSLAGSVGFVGLIVPHLVRLAIGSDHRTLLPAALLMGGTLLVIADLLARTILAPQQLPVGVVTALIGVPIFLYILNRNMRPGR